MGICKIYQMVNVPDYRHESNDPEFNYESISTDANTKTTSLLEAINFLTLEIFGLTEEEKVDISKIQNLSGIIADLSDMAFTTNKICYEAQYLNGLRSGLKK